MAESTFGRRAVNDGKLVQRLREASGSPSTRWTASRPTSRPPPPAACRRPAGSEVVPEKRDPRANFRFFENRQKYLLFVHTCSEKR